MRLSAIALALLVANQATAQTHRCAGIDEDAERLSCYDAAFSSPVETPAGSDWQLHRDVSDMTDEENVFLTVISDEPVQCRFGGGELVLTARCVENTTALTISGDCHMSSTPYHNWGHVTYRIDDQDAAIWRMDASTNNRALGLWRGRSSIPEIRKLFGAESLRVRVNVYGQNAVETSFNVTGLEEAIAPLRQACGW